MRLPSAWAGREQRRVEQLGCPETSNAPEKTPCADHRQVFPSGRTTRTMGPGVEVQENLTQKRRGGELEDMTSLE